MLRHDFQHNAHALHEPVYRDSQHPVRRGGISRLEDREIIEGNSVHVAAAVDTSILRVMWVEGRAWCQRCR